MDRYEAIEAATAALERAFPGQSKPLVLALEQACWTEPQGNGCAFCGRTDATLLLRAICERCVVVAKEAARARVRRTLVPGPDLLLAQVTRALDASGRADAADIAETVGRAIASRTVREEAPDETCLVCDRRRPAVPSFVLGPSRSICAFCLERLHAHVTRRLV